MTARSLSGVAARWGRGLIDLALPPRCPGCGAIVGGDTRFCDGCWSGLRFLGPPWCAGCALPFDHDRGEGARCAPCLARPPRHAGIRAAVAYGAVARRLALRLKYGGRIAYADVAARLMLRHLPDDADLIVPVPLHRWRGWRRGYNQAALLGDALARTRGVPSDRAALVRWRATTILRGLGRRQRYRALKGAIRARDGVALDGRHIVLVDDVVASGATVDACTAALLGAGAARVTVLAWARVIADDDPDH